MLPVGISFYTFQTLSYVIDVYTERIPAERNFGYYATFVSFFPQLVAGPIERTDNLLPQIKKCKQFDYTEASYGLKIMLWGFFKKVVVADNIATYVDLVYSNVYTYSGFSFPIIVFFFTLQIYCDFSGYSDIALGVAKLLGIDLMKNFASPYFASSIKEFWSRWHISLSTWFRDYVYIPLGGNRCKPNKHYLNLIITFLLSGLWHGASWNFVIWGLIHGISQVFEIIINKVVKTNVPTITKILFVFLYTNITWIFFRSNNLHEAFYIITHSLDGIFNPVTYLRMGFVTLGITIEKLILISFTILLLLVFDFFNQKNDVIKTISEQNIIVKWSIYISMTVLVIILSAKGAPAEFVYFQF